MEALRGRLLVATPAIESGPFLRSVVFLLDHDDEGALGVVVNRPLEADLADLLPVWTGYATSPVCLFDGGPVQRDSALAVGVVDVGVVVPPGWRQMTGRVGVVDLDAPPPPDDVYRGVRVFAGYAGWAAGQVEDELAEGSWLVVDAAETDLLSPRPEDLWREVLRRQVDDRRLWATFPPDPAVN